jgi:pSer/pThr/pTyr-binding forkhead associated (FHA) protein
VGFERTPPGKAGVVRELGHYELLEACGLRDPLTVHVERPGAPGVTQWRLPQPFAVVGKQPGCDVVLEDDEGVSGRHLYLQLVGGQLFAVDLASEQGTRWGGESRPNGWVPPESVLDVGPFRVGCRWECVPNLRPDGEAPSPLARGSWADSGGAAVALEVASPFETRPRWRVDRRLTLVGRAESCKIRLRSTSVSRFHCALIRVRLGLLLLDLGGRGGVAVNGKRVRSGLLEPNDEVALGEFTLRVHSEGGSVVPLAREAPVYLPGPLAGPPLRTSESLEGLLLLRLLDQFALIQQQMYDHFQQTLLTAMRMTNPGLPPAPDVRPSPAAQPPPSELVELTARLQSLCEELSRQRRADGAALPAPPVGPTPQLRPPPAARAAGVDRPAQPPPARAPRPEGRPEPTPAAAPGDDVHALLVERLRAIEDEGKSRWSGLFDFLRKS